MTGFVSRPADVSVGLDYVEFDVRLARDGDCPAATKATYMALSTFANIEDHTTLSVEATAGFSEEARRALLPYRSSLAARIGRSVDTVDKAHKDLSARGLLVIAPQDAEDGSLDANVYHLTDREQWARRTLERAEARTAALAAGTPWPPRREGPYVPRVYRDPGFDFVKLDAPTVARGDRAPNYKALYAAVASFVNGTTRVADGTQLHPPTNRELCACTGLKSRSVATYLSAMVDDGLLLITERYDDENGGRIASAYKLMDAKWWAQRALARMQDAEDEHARENDLVEGVAASVAGGWPRQLQGGGRVSCRGVAASVADHYKKVARSEQDEWVADAVGQSAGGFARADASDGAADEIGDAESGSAASEPIPPQRKPSPRPVTRKTTPRQTPPGFEDVRAAIPAAVARPGTRLYPGLHRAIVDLLTGTQTVPSRTPEQVIARLGRRWFGEHAETRSAPGYRGCDRCTPSGCKAARDACNRILNKSSWLAAALLTQDCPDAACEDGVMLDGTGKCRACLQRAADRRRNEENAAAAAAHFGTGNPSATDRETWMATLDGWSEAAHAEELRFRHLLTARGVFGAMLEHQVREHMAGWQVRHPAPAAPAVPRSELFAEPVADEDEPDVDGLGEEDQGPEDGASWEIAAAPSRAYREWKAKATAEREQRAAERLGALASR